MFLLDKPRFIERKLCIIHEISIQLRQQIRCCRSFYADKSEFTVQCLPYSSKWKGWSKCLLE